MKAVIFDIGNVLVRWDPRFLYRGRFETDAEMEYFLDTVTTGDWNLAQDKGRSFEEAVAILSTKYPQYTEMIALYDRNWIETIGGTISESVTLLEQLVANGIAVFGLTNFSAEKWPIFCEQFSFTDLFQDVIVSGIEKLIKPDPRIYELAIRRFSVDPSHTIFIDDRIENVEGAKNIGMAGHHFIDATALRSDLASRGLLDL